MSEKFNKIKANVLMWEIDGNSKMQSYAEELAEITAQLKSLEIEIQEMNNNITILDKRINIYLGNIFGIQNFEQSKHAIYVKGKHVIEVYDINEINLDDDLEFGEFEVDESLKPLIVHKSNPKQQTKILNYLQEYNDVIDDFHIALEDYEDYSEAYKLLWSEVKEITKNINFITTIEDKDIERYDEEKHVLLIALNKDDEWGFRYIRKEDEKELNEYLNKDQEEDELDIE